MQLDVFSVVDWARGVLPRDNREHLAVAVVDSEYRLIDYMRISRGQFATCEVSAREVTEWAQNAGKRVILVHNHLSKHCVPSWADRQLTMRVASEAKRADIELLGHVIMSHESLHDFTCSVVIDGRMIHMLFSESLCIALSDPGEGEEDL